MSVLTKEEVTSYACQQQATSPFTKLVLVVLLMLLLLLVFPLPQLGPSCFSLDFTRLYPAGQLAAAIHGRVDRTAEKQQTRTCEYVVFFTFMFLPLTCLFR